jgi:drug/metabolite transporter (DMT)-like permease
MTAQTQNRSANVGRLLVIVTAAGWGLGWPMMKLVMHDWPPLFARGTAGVIAATGLVSAAALRGDALLPPRALLRRLALAAGTNVFAWMGFTALSLLWLNVSEAALVTFTMPIWATLLAWPLLGERPAMRSVLALCLGIAGLLLLMGGNLDGGAERLPGVALALSAAILFALGAVTSRQPIPLPPLVLTAWLIGLGSMAMVVVGLMAETPRLQSLTLAGAGALAYMSVGPMALCYLAWFGALKRIPTTTASTGLLLIPIIGALSAALILSEPLGMREFAAFALTLGGVALELRRRA